MMRSIIALAILGVTGMMLVALTAEMPPFGDLSSPSLNYVVDRYMYRAVDDTGAINIVTSIVLDYRGFDTLGETTVLFVAILAATAAVTSATKRVESRRQCSHLCKDAGDSEKCGRNDGWKAR